MSTSLTNEEHAALGPRASSLASSLHEKAAPAIAWFKSTATSVAEGAVDAKDKVAAAVGYGPASNEPPSAEGDARIGMPGIPAPTHTVESIPREKWPDSSLGLLREGNTFGQARFRAHGSDVFQCRLEGHAVTIAYGEDAVKQFYVPNRMTRAGAIPLITSRLLQNSNSVAGLDAEAHAHRKKMFVSVMPRAMVELVEGFEKTWMEHMAHWHKAEKPLCVETIATEVLMQAVCEWTDVPITKDEIPSRALELFSAYDCAASAGPRMWLAMVRRRRFDGWLRGIVQKVRSGEIKPRPDSVLAIFCAHTNHATHPTEPSKLMSETDLVTELGNVLRPIVAVARWIMLAALALHDFPETRERVREEMARLDKSASSSASSSGNAREKPLEGTAQDQSEYSLWMAQEVRRFYPFFPLLTGLVREPFEWRGQTFAKDAWMLIDVNATHRDERIWPNSDKFQPERFKDWNWSQLSYRLIPQGGGDFVANHRCPGDHLAVHLTRSAIRMMACKMEYTLPPQDLTIGLTRIPAVPKSRVLITNVCPGTRGERTEKPAAVEDDGAKQDMSQR